MPGHIVISIIIIINVFRVLLYTVFVYKACVDFKILCRRLNNIHIINVRVYNIIVMYTCIVCEYVRRRAQTLITICGDGGGGGESKHFVLLPTPSPVNGDGVGDT